MWVQSIGSICISTEMHVIFNDWMSTFECLPLYSAVFIIMVSIIMEISHLLSPLKIFYSPIGYLSSSLAVCIYPLVSHEVLSNWSFKKYWCENFPSYCPSCAVKSVQFHFDLHIGKEYHVYLCPGPQKQTIQQRSLDSVKDVHLVVFVYDTICKWCGPSMFILYMERSHFR